MDDDVFIAIFGGNATQTLTEIVIPKSGLNMTPTANNGGEQIFAALTKNAKGHFSTKRFEEDPTINILIEEGSAGAENRKENDVLVPYRKYSIVTSFWERDANLTGGIYPDKY
jgi:hypothetical protein